MHVGRRAAGQALDGCLGDRGLEDPPAVGAEATPAAGIEALRSFIAATASAQGEFKQQVYDRKHKLTQESSGTLAVDTA